MIFKSLVSKKELLSQIELNTAIKTNTAAVIENATAKASASKVVEILTAEQQKELMFDQLLTKEQLEQVASELGLQVAQNGTLISTKALNAEKLNEILMSQGVQKETREEILEKMALTAANNKAVKSVSILGKALNLIKAHPIIAVISVITGIGIAAFARFNDTAEETAEKVDSLMNTFKSVKSQADSEAKTIQSLASEYETLSKGVSDLGENINLSEDQFSRYHEIVNQIADISPELVDGWDKQGNAIINLKGNVDELTESYKRAQIEAYNTLINGDEDGEGDASDVIKKYKDVVDSGKFGLQNLGNKDQIAYFEELIKNSSNQKDLLKFWDTSREVYGYSYLKLLKNISGLNSFDGKSDFIDKTDTDEALKNIVLNAKTKIIELKSEIESELGNMHTVADAYLNLFLLQDEDYKDIDENVQTALSLIVNSLDENFIKSAGLDTPEKISAYVQSLLNAVIENEDISNGLSELFKFEDGDLNVIPFVQELQKRLDELGIEINLTPIISDELDAKERLNNSLGNRGDYAQGAEGLRKYAADRSMLYNYTKDFTTEEAEHWLEVTNGIVGATNKIKAYENAVKSSKDTSSFSQQLSHIQALSKGLDQLDSIMADIVEGEDFDYSSILNNEDFTETFGKYKEEYENFIETVTNSPDDLSKCKSAFDELATAYVYGSDALSNLTEETKDAAILELTQMGVANATEIVTETLERYSDALNFAKQETFDLANATTQEISDFIDSKNVVDKTAESFFYYALQKQLASDTGLSTASDCEQLIALAEQAKLTGDIINKLRMLLDMFSSDGAVTWGAATKELAKKEIEKAFAELSTIDVDFKNGSKTKASMAKAGKDAAEEYKEALEKELSDLDTVLNFITSTIQDQIDLWGDQKDAAVDALEAERDAAIEALEAQKEALQAQIDAKQKVIDKIKEAREERQAEIDLQQKQYELERLQNQRSIMTYKNGQVVYETDTRAIFEAREAVDEAKENIEILKIEKEISVLEDAIDNIDKQIDSVNEHYDKLIKQTEAYYDALIKGMEEYKSRWEELSEIEEQAKINVLLQELGITTDDVLNMSGEAFEQFKQRYLDILTEMYNDESKMISAINDAANGIDADKLTEGLGKTKDNIDKLATTDYTSVTNGISGISNSLNDVPSSEKFDTLAGSLDSVAKAIQGIASALGLGEDGTVSGLVSALQEISKISLGEGETGVIGQFHALKTAIDEVTSAISGGGSKANEGGGIATGTNGGAATPNMSGDGEGSGLTGAIKEIGTTTDETFGMAGESSEEGEGVLGKFGQFKKAVDEVTKAIGTGEEDKEEEMSLISALKKHYEVAENTVPEVKGFFDELLNSIIACVAQLQTMVSLMESTSSTHVSAGGSNHGGGGSNRGGYKGTVGNAFAKGTEDIESLPITGYNGLPHNEKNALRSEYGQPELTVYPNGTTELTTKPIMSDLPKGTVIFNEEQTRRIMNGKGSILGKAFAGGTYSPVASIKGIDIKSIQDKFLGKLDNIIVPVNSIDRNVESMVRMGNNIHTNNASQDVHISIGDIQVHGVQDVNGLANAITTKLPNTLLQTMTKRK